MLTGALRTFVNESFLKSFNTTFMGNIFFDNFYPKYKRLKNSATSSEKFFQRNSSFTDSSSTGNFFPKQMLCLLREVQCGCSVLEKNFSEELEFHRLEFHWENLFLPFALFTQRGPVRLLYFVVFLLEELEFHRLEFFVNFFFVGQILLFFLCPFQESLTGEFFLSFFLVMQTNQKLKRVHAPGERQCSYKLRI